MKYKDLLFKFGKAYDLVCSESLICAIESKVELYDKHTGELVATLSDLMHPSCAVFTKDNHLIVKNTFGKYYIYNLENFTLEKKISINNYNHSQDDGFVMLENDRYILSTAYKFPDTSLLLYDLSTDEYTLLEWTNISFPVFIKTEQGKIYAVGNNTNVVPRQIDYFDILLFDLTSIVHNRKIPEPILIGTGYRAGKCDIFNNTLIMDLDRQILIYDLMTNSGETFTYLSKCEGVKCLEISENGKYFATAQSSEVFIFSVEEKRVLERLDTDMCYSLKFIDNDTKLLIGSWKKSYCISQSGDGSGQSG